MTALQPRHCFGVQGGLRNGLCYAEEGSLLYACGQSVVLQNVDSRAQRFIAGSAEGQGVTAVAVCQAKRLLAVAERGAGAERPTVTIFDLEALRRKKVLLAGADAGSKEVLSLSFSSDGRLLAVLGGAPDWTLGVWAWEKSKLLASAKATTMPSQAPAQCLVAPGADPSAVSVVGEGLIRTFLIEGGTALKPAPAYALGKRGSHRYTCHAYLTDSGGGGGVKETLVVGVEGGEVLVLQDGEVRQVLQLETGVESLVASPKGFVVGGSRGTLTVVDRDSESKPYRVGKTFQVGEGAAGQRPGGAAQQPAAGRVLSLTASTLEDGIACLTEDSHLAILTIPTTDRKGEQATLRHVSSPHHAGPVLGLATCIQRPVVVTCGADRTVRFWNYQDQRVEMVHACEGDVLSVALHPTGHALLAGFADKLCLMAVLADSLRTVKEFPVKGCRDCRFSAGGQYFAAVSSNTVHVFSAYTYAPIAVLRGHAGKIRSMEWSADDSTLLTAGADGTVCKWRVLEGSQEVAFTQKGQVYSSVVAVPGPVPGPKNGGGGVAAAASAGQQSGSILAATADGKLQVLEAGEEGGLLVSSELPVGGAFSQILATGSGQGGILVAATEEGAVRSYSLPPSSTFQAHRYGLGGATRMATTHDSALLFVGTSQGSLVAYDVKGKEPAGLLARRPAEGPTFSQEVLVMRAEVGEQRRRIGQLECQLADAAAQQEYQLRLRDVAMAEEARKLQEKSGTDAAAAAQRCEALAAELAAVQAEHAQRAGSAQRSFESQLADAEEQYARQLAGEAERYAALRLERDALDASWQARAAALVEQHGRVVEEAGAAAREELERERHRSRELQQEYQQARAEWEELQAATEEEADREVEEIRARLEGELQSERVARVRATAENGLLLRRFGAQQQGLEERDAALAAAQAAGRRLQSDCDALRAEAAASRSRPGQRPFLSGVKFTAMPPTKRFRDTRDAALAESERRCQEVRSQLAAAERARQEQEQRRGAAEAAVAAAQAALADRERGQRAALAAVEALSQEQTSAALAAQGQRARERALRASLRQEAQARDAAARGLSRVLADLEQATRLIHSPDELRAAVVAAFRRHAAAQPPGEAAPAPAVSDPPQAAGGSAKAGPAAAQQAQLAAATQRAEREARRAAEAQRRLVAENAELVKEVRQLRAQLLQPRRDEALSGAKPSQSPDSVSIAVRAA